MFFVTGEREMPEVTAPAEAVTGPRRGVIWARLLIGLIVLISAEVFSGASVRMGLWHPWTWLVTFGLYFAHFFLLTTLAVRTGRTSLGALYLWGVLFGMYEPWITKVIWHGYAGDGQFVLGAIGAFGFSEISMIFLFHPVMSFIGPLAVTCVLFPSLRSVFPDLAWITGPRRGGRLLRLYVVASFAPIVAVNGGAPLYLAANLAFILGLLLVLLRLARPDLRRDDDDDALAIVAFGRLGVIGLCAYLLLLYGVTYPLLRPDGLASAGVQLLTFAFYSPVIAGLWLHRSRRPLAGSAAPPAERREGRAIVVVLAATLGIGLILSAVPARHVIYTAITANFILWTPLGFVLTALAIWQGTRSYALAGGVPRATRERAHAASSSANGGSGGLA